ncbi:testis-expressed protein 2 isoform X2 [Gouania willdenowi]|uniref:testis-expressed protein 2 isoform X2 n=1 Tax=Gouania willdenowi TaxID=441366 RepID=UPI0010566CDC|nr:testis-expressed protein 2 isoform X2 [Gouania willdenowi]
MMSSQGSGSSKGSAQHGDTLLPRHAPGPKLQVQRSLSRDTITIHFSALGKDEDDDDEELYGVPAMSAAATFVSDRTEGVEGVALKADGRSVTTGLEAKEELLFESAVVEADPSTAGAAVLSVSSTTLSVQPSDRQQTSSPAMSIASMSSPTNLSSTPPASSSWPSERPPAIPPSTNSNSSSPCKSATLPSSKPFLSLVRSLSNDIESRETSSMLSTGAPPHARHRHLMKSFVKSLSTDTAKTEQPEGPLHHFQQQQPQSSHRHPPRNMQLFKQFSQPRLSSSPVIVTQVGGDSKTAPSSPIMSPDGRSFFKVQEVEAKIEDTKRRLSEVMSDPLQLFSKIMGDESNLGAVGNASHRTKSLSSSASELSGGTAVNGHAENSNYSIKEEDATEGDEEETSTMKASDSVFSLAPATGITQASSSALHKSPSLTLGRCSMSALVARQEDEEFCELYSEDFEVCTDTETPDGDRHPQTGSTGLCSEIDTEEDRLEEEVEAVPVTGLVFLAQIVFLYLLLPVPPSVCSVVHGIVTGFMLALLVLWMSSSQRSLLGSNFWRRRVELWNMGHLDIKEPGIFKGWMNEIYSYDPETYHATLTHSVYVRLEGSVLRLSKPNRNISRRATHNEPKPDVTFISQKIYDLTDSKIYLMPQSLARKRVWNKKYPICIELAKQEDFMSKAQGEMGEEKFAGPVEKQEQTEKCEKTDSSAPGEEPKRPMCGGGDLTIYLFGRTGREKEEWFRRFLLSSQMKSEGKAGVLSLPFICKSAFLPSQSRSGSIQSGGGVEADSRSSSRGSLEELSQSQSRYRESSAALACGSTGAIKQKMLLDYNVYMAKYVNPQAPPRSPTATDSPELSPVSSPKATKKLNRRSEDTDEPEAWVNAFLGRIFWDFLGEKYWADVVSKKIQMKLSKIRLPYVMNELTLTELDMGFSIPKILQASKPSVDHQGLWFDLEISYTGSFLMTLETKMNLARLGKEGEGLGEHGKEWPRTYCLADSDEESSSAGSSDEEDAPDLLSDKPALPGGEGYVGGHRPSKIMRFVDKIAKSKYFQKATETEFIKKKMEEVANTPLLLTVEVQECRGTLAVNIPPPPTDRIWYGFRNPPHLELKARPKLGEREVTLGHVTEWIEKKLDQEFQKIFVMPNMDDIWLPIMHSAMDTRSNANLITVTNDELKDPEPEESGLCDM